MTETSDATVAGLGPRPVRLNHDPTTQLSAARTGVLDALSETTKPVTVQQLSARLGQHTNTVREHLDALVAMGLANRIPGVATGRGRPPIHYRAVPPERSRPQLREYATLASVLAEQISRTSRDPVGDAIAAGLLWGNALGAKGPDGREGARSRTIEVIDSLGFDPAERPDGSVDLRQCPLLEAAKQNPTIVCGVHLGMAQALHMAHGAPAEEVSLEPFAKTGACILRFRQNGSAGPAFVLPPADVSADASADATASRTSPATADPGESRN